MNRYPVSLFVVAMMVISGPGPLMMGQDTPAGRAGAMFSTNSMFDDNSTSVQKDFYSAGTDNTTSISVPASAIILSASLNVSGALLQKEDLFTNDTTSDFGGGELQNITARNGSLSLQPLLARATYNTSSQPAGIAAGDLNLDGRIDLAVADSGAATVGVMLQNMGANRFDPQVNCGVGASPQAVAVGDLNLDGRQDIAVACRGPGTLEVLLQAGDGSMGNAVQYQSGAGACGVAIGEFNRDALKDVVVVNSGDSTISLFLQTAGGTLTRKCVVSTGAGPSAVAAGDINLDGKDEAVVACRNSSTVVVFEQNMSAGLRQNTSYNAASGPVGVAIGDVNRDGRKDVVVAQQGAGSIGVFLQTSSGLLGQRADYPAAGAPSSVAVGDLNYDGRADIAAGSGAQNISIFWQKQDGTLGPWEDYIAGNGPAGVAIADLNYDGKNDLAVANSGDSTVGVLPLRPIAPGTLGQMVTYGVGGSPVGLKGGELSSDGLDDLAVADTSLVSTMGLGVLLQTQAGVMAPQVLYNTGSTPQGLKGVAVCDINRDGRNDVVGTNMDTGGFFIFYQTQAGDFSGTPAAYAMNISSGGYQIACGDLNTDGWPDIAFSSIYAMPSGTEPYLVSVFMQDWANNTFVHTWDYYCEYARGVGIGDITGDGRDDLVMVQYIQNNIIVYTQNPNGTLNSTGAVYPTTSGPHGMRIGDCNGDGRNDVAVGAWYGNTIDVLTQTAQGGLNAKVGYPISTNCVDIDLLDYDGDGLNDLAGSAYSAGTQISLINQTKDGKFSASSTIQAGTTPANIAHGDFNGDGRTDLAVTNRGDGKAGIFLQMVNIDMNGTFISRFTQFPYKVTGATAHWNCTATPDQTVSVWLTNDRGANWTEAKAGEPVVFSSEGSALGYKVWMNSSALNSSPSFDDITVYYTVMSYPINPSVDVGAGGSPSWKHTGAFGASGKNETVDFMDRLGEALETSAPGPDGRVHLAITVSSGSLGSLILDGLLVEYDITPMAPALQNLTDDGFINTQLPSFQMSAHDNDTRSLMFRIELSINNFTTVRRSFDQSNQSDGWDKASYKPGETATFQLQTADRLSPDGPYQWRAFVWDGTVWSASSPVGRFRVDTKAPVARVQPLPAFTNQTDVLLKWNGSDPEPGSGLALEATFNILYKDRDNAAWQVWLEDTNETSATFTGVPGKTYYFQAKATDKAGNSGATAPGNGDTRITVDTSPPSGSVRDDGATTADNTRLHATLTFTDPESGVVSFQYWISTRPGETENYTWGPEATTGRDVSVGGLFLMNGTRYYMGVKALNGAGLWSPATSSDGIEVKLKIPAASVGAPNGPQKDTDIPVTVAGTDPNNVGITDGDLEYRVANVTTRSTLDWSEWKEAGDSDWGDRTNGTEPYLFHGEPGKAYKFRYRVKDRTGAFSDFAESGNVTRINRPPRALIAAPANGTTGEELVFSANSSGDPDGDKVEYSWDFGDGSTATGKVATHIFQKGKLYTVTLTVDDSIEQATATTEILIKAPPAPATPVASLPWIYIVAAVMVVAAIGLLAVLATRKKKAPPAQEHRVRGVPARAAAPEEPAPPAREEPAAAPPSPAPVDQSQTEEQVTAAMDAVAELRNKGLAADRADKILGLATGAFADGRLETASNFAQKVLRMRDELVQGAAAQKAQESPEDKRGAIENSIKEVEALGSQAAGVETELDMARMFLEDKDFEKAMKHAEKAMALATAAGEKAAAAPPDKSVKKAKKAPVARAIRSCQSCGTELEPDWMVCPNCERPV